jgi:hypothetical protein
MQDSSIQETQDEGKDMFTTTPTPLQGLCADPWSLEGLDSAALDEEVLQTPTGDLAHSGRDRLEVEVHHDLAGGSKLDLTSLGRDISTACLIASLS